MLQSAKSFYARLAYCHELSAARAAACMTSSGSRSISRWSSSSSSSSSRSRREKENASIYRPHRTKLISDEASLSQLLPCTSELIIGQLLPSGYAKLLLCEEQSAPKSSSSSSAVQRRERLRQDSWLELVLPFASEEASLPLRNSMIKIDGKTLRYGKLFEILDAFAADVAYRHCLVKGEAKDTALVTASVDGLHAFDKLQVSEDLKLQAYLSWVGTSSLEVHVNIISAPKDRPEHISGSTQFIMAARHPLDHSKSKTVLGLCAETEEEKLEFARGAARALRRRQKASSSLQLMPPLAEEVALIHDLYVHSRNLKLQKEHLLNGSTTLNAEMKQIAEQRGRFKYMKHTIQKSITPMHAQNRNIHGKVFGGHVMRLAFELAHISALLFTGQEQTRFHSVDDIQFVKPVNVGAIMEFSATIVYSQSPYLVVNVVAHDVDARTAFRTKTNVLNYVFVGNSAEQVPSVMPRDYDEFVMFLDGKRILASLIG